jgi:hypothetical protein
MANATSTQLQELYVAYFGRAADPTGLDYWTEKGISQAAFAANMYAQAEFKDNYGSKSVEAQVNQIYKNLFDRESDVAGLTYWTQQINLGNLKVAEIATHLIWAAQNNSGSSDDKKALSNRTNAAVAYTAKVKSSTANILAYQPTTTDPWVAGANITAGVSYLSGIDKDTAHTAAGIDASIATFSSTVATAGKSFVLTTTSAGASEGASGNDTWVALDNALTLYSVDGSSGTDSLTATLSGNDSYSVANVENLTFKVSTASTVDMTDFSGEETVTVQGSANTTLNNNAAATTYTSKLTGTATLDIDLSDATGTADSVGLTLDGSSSTGVTTIDGVETITVTSTDDADSLSIDGNALATLNIKGSGDATFVLPVGTLLTTVDASSATGDLTIELPANEVTFTGGTGADTITMSSASLTDKDSVDGGAGADTLSLTASGAAYGSVATDKTLSVSNVETLALATGAESNAIDFDLFATPTIFTKVEITSSIDTADITLTDIQTDTVSIRNTNNVSVADTLAIFTYDKKDSSSTSDSATFEITNRDLSETFTIGAFTASGIENITFATTGGTQGDITVSGLTAAAAESITITGDADLTLPAFGTNVVTVAAGDSTGDLSLTFAGADTTVTTGSGADTIAYGTSLTSDDTIDGGAGTDTLTVGAINANAQNLDLSISNIERFSITETSDSDANATFDFNGDVISRLTVVAENTAANTVTFEDIGAGNIDLNVSAVTGAATDTIAIDRASDTSTDSVDIALTAAGTVNFEGTLTVNDAETITIDTTNSSVGHAYTIADLDASDATSVTFTNDDTFDTADVLALTLNSIKTGATIDFTGYGQDIGAPNALADNAGADGVASTTGKITNAAAAMGTDGFTAVATGSYTIKLGDGRTGAHTTSINLGASNTGADTIQFVNSASDSTNDLGIVVIDNFNDAAGAIVTNRSLLDFSGFAGIKQVSDLTITTAELDDEEAITVITAAGSDADDFAGTITVLGVASSSWAAADFVFAA